jgi:hypothetical protein
LHLLRGLFQPLHLFLELSRQLLERPSALLKIMCEFHNLLCL